MSGNENCQEVRNLIKVMMMLEVVGKIWEVREGREGEGWLLITDIQNISTKHKAGKVVVKTWFIVFITSFSSSGQGSLLLLLSRIFLKKPNFIQVSNSQQSPRTAENGTTSQRWALEDLTHS